MSRSVWLYVRSFGQLESVNLREQLEGRPDCVGAAVKLELMVGNAVIVKGVTVVSVTGPVSVAQMRVREDCGWIPTQTHEP
jgi:hypothetical protein